MTPLGEKAKWGKTGSQTLPRQAEGVLRRGVRRPFPFPNQLVAGHMGSTLMGPLQKVRNFDSLGKKIRPSTFGKINYRLTGVPKESMSKNMKFAVTPLVLTPLVPFRISAARSPGVPSPLSTCRRGSEGQQTLATPPRPLHSANQFYRGLLHILLVRCIQASAYFFISGPPSERLFGNIQKARP